MISKNGNTPTTTNVFKGSPITRTSVMDVRQGDYDQDAK
jgi:hypothetical protein